jgi:hypothetical protein
MTGMFRAREICSPTTRVMMSLAPPGANGTTIFKLGGSWAKAGVCHAAMTSAPTAMWRETV